ncbi:Peptidoglycan/LPS O-acetylase OafA/YrhL, contains acyltransferase and SGNH-hydrolase domains [Dyadobacter sp. SG02]|uniref:acyltransferase family protein n=1 Tax=Dyadobacter sp. SG02 TaxID=1855291 RepID=UPI0008AE45A2|nr:acyltransferase [Dyadobacter sp. SG02]SEJ72783.1 Peptidoglycan/LPS O-acetylase OafA/YrhL, contains acyltransferase and SGNH-hydrolase domains [Dyadobacter sp. SG02]
MKHNTKFLDGVRLVLALWVAVGHLYKYMGGESFLDIPIIGRLVLYNGAAVDGFMVITGFLMMYHYSLRENKEPPTERSTAMKFYLRRLFRIYPLYLLGIIAAYCLFSFNATWVNSNYEFFAGHSNVFTTTYNINNVPGYIDLLTHLTFLHGFIPGQNVSILGPAWSLSLEMQFYAIFPILFVILLRGKNTAMIAFFVISLVCLYLSPIIFGDWNRSGSLISLGAPSMITHKLIYFYFGMLISNVLMRRSSWTLLAVSIVLAAPVMGIVSTGVLMIIVLFMFADDIHYNWISSPLQITRNVFSGKVSKWGADVSYSLYLIHMIVMPGIIHFAISLGLNKYLTGALALFLFLGVNFVIGTLLYQYLEKPFINIGKRVITTKEQQLVVNV